MGNGGKHNDRRHGVGHLNVGFPRRNTEDSAEDSAEVSDLGDALRRIITAGFYQNQIDPVASEDRGEIVLVGQQEAEFAGIGVEEAAYCLEFAEVGCKNFRVGLGKEECDMGC